MLPGKKYLPEDIVRIAWARRWYIVVPFVIVSTVTAIVSWYWPNKYRSEAIISLVPQRVPETYVKSTVTMRTEDRLQALYQKLLTRSTLEKLISDLKLYPRERQFAIMEDVVERMRKDIRIESIKGDAFRVSYVSQDARTAKEVADRLAGFIMDESTRDRTGFAESTSTFLAAQLEGAKRQLEAHEKKLADYKLAHAGELPSEREANLQVLANTQMQVQNLNQKMAQARDRRYLLERRISELSVPTQTAVPTVAMSSDDPSAVAGASTAVLLQAARAQLQAIRLRYKADHPDVLRLQRTIRELEAKAQAEALQAPLSPGAEPRAATPEEAQRLTQLKNAQTELEMVDRQLATDQAEEKRLRGVMAGYQAHVEAIPTRESELTSLLRDYDTLSKNYQSLLAKQEDSKVAAAMEDRAIGEQFRTIDAARVPEKPVSPNRPVIDLLGAMIGLALGVGIVGFLEYRDNSFRTDEEIVRVLSLPVVAVIPLMLSGEERRARKRRSLMVGTATLVVTVGAISAAVWFFLRYGF